MHIQCFSCQSKIEVHNKIGFREDCEKCGHDLHSCVQCLYYDPKVYNECKEPSADRIVKKERMNYCDCFSLKPFDENPLKSKTNTYNSPSEALAAAEALFKKK